jgi:hypothetical protein
MTRPPTEAAYFGALSSCIRASARPVSRSYSSAILRIVSLAGVDQMFGEQVPIA